MAGISDLTAAQLSRVAYYPNDPLPAGWVAYKTVNTLDGTNSFTILTNGNQAVFAFKGSDNISNFKSDLIDSGGSAWKDIKPLAERELNLFKDSHPNYEIMTDGHSLGGGMAQSFAL